MEGSGSVQRTGKKIKKRTSLPICVPYCTNVLYIQRLCETNSVLHPLHFQGSSSVILWIRIRVLLPIRETVRYDTGSDKYLSQFSWKNHQSLPKKTLTSYIRKLMKVQLETIMTTFFYQLLAFHDRTWGPNLDQNPNPSNWLTNRNQRQNVLNPEHWILSW